MRKLFRKISVKWSGSRKAKYAAQVVMACRMGRFCEVCLPAVEPKLFSSLERDLR